MAPLCTDDFDYQLPQELIAQRPPLERDGGRLLRLALSDPAAGDATHHQIRDLPRLLPPRTLLVVNQSAVIPARLAARRPSGGRVELLLIERLEQAAGRERWLAMLRASKRPPAGERLALLDADGGATAAEVEVVSAPVNGRSQVWLDAGAPARFGAPPLPPYIQRAADPSDHQRYQTVYARDPGSVAAPTAGLHLSDSLLGAIDRAGHSRVALTLHVGPGTFVPVRVSDVTSHEMESERYTIPEATARAIAAARDEGRPVVAVGTTTARALEGSGGVAGDGRTRLFIYPGYRFRVIDGLLTNFHLPKSTLLMLVSALGGRERVLAAYAEAVARRYRFYSYGDAMLLA